jgi:hypothetical protein
MQCLAKTMCIIAAAGCVLAFDVASAQAGTLGGETFYVVNDTTYTLLLTPPPPTNPYADFFTTYIGLDYVPNPPPSEIPPFDGVAPYWWVNAVNPFNLDWSVSYGVQAGTGTVVSQYCEFGGDTTVSSDVTEGVIRICSSGENGTGMTGTGYLQVTFADAYTCCGDEGGTFRVTAPSVSDAVPEPPSLVLLASAIGVLGLGGVFRILMAPTRFWAFLYFVVLRSRRASAAA